MASSSKKREKTKNKKRVNKRRRRDKNARKEGRRRRRSREGENPTRIFSSSFIPSPSSFFSSKNDRITYNMEDGQAFKTGERGR